MLDAKELFVGDKMEALVRVGFLDVAFKGGGKGIRALALDSTCPRAERASYE
jgi:hypothetical protein